MSTQTRYNLLFTL